MSSVPAAYPFIEVTIDTSALTPVAQRAPGVIAVVGKTPADATGGTAAVNAPQVVDELSQAAGLFASVGDGGVVPTTLYSSLRLALMQDPRPSKVYGVRVSGDNYAAALSALEAVDDVAFVSLASETSVGATAGGGNPATGLTALKEHVEDMSAQGQKRIGVAMIDPATAKSNTYVADVDTAVNALQSASSRMVLIAARGAQQDVATAAMAAIAGYEPHVSILLKQVRGISMPKEKQYGPSEIKGLSEKGINPIIDPALIVGEGLHFAEGRCYTSNPALLYVDIVRTLDDIEFRLKAGLIGMVGDARITKAGLTRVKSRMEGILGPLQRRGVIDNFAIDIPVLNILSIPESARTATDDAIVNTARANRMVDLILTVTYGPAVHQLKIKLSPKF